MLTGNVAPRGCVMKPAAADERLLKHRGKVIAFENYNHMAREIERDDLDVTPDQCWSEKRRPQGRARHAGMGQLPIPKKLVKGGVRDMVRVSDARMSGTSYGACILHVAPESFVGGPLALVQTGDEIEIDVAARAHTSPCRRRRALAPPRRLESRRLRVTRAATARCIRSISDRPTKAATSIFSKARRRPPSRKFTSRRGGIQPAGSITARHSPKPMRARPGLAQSRGR